MAFTDTKQGKYLPQSHGFTCLNGFHVFHSHLLIDSLVSNINVAFDFMWLCLTMVLFKMITQEHMDPMDAMYLYID